MTDDPRPRVLPPLGPPYVTAPGRPPPPQYPPSPPDRWPVTPPLLPSPAAAPALGPRWIDRLKRPAVVWATTAVVMAVIVGALIGWSTNDDLTRATQTPTTVTAPRSVAPP